MNTKLKIEIAGNMGRTHGLFRRIGAFTLPEVLLCIPVIGVMFVLHNTVHRARTFATNTNYLDLDQCSPNALDRVLLEIRQKRVAQWCTIPLSSPGDLEDNHVQVAFSKQAGHTRAPHCDEEKARN